MTRAIYYHQYRLRSRAPLNALSSRREHRGFLLRVGDGYGCVHPWPELGDAPVEAQLERLRRGLPTPLLARAYRCARLDGSARRQGRSLFEGLEIPPSHATVPEDARVPPPAAGYAAVKLKCGGPPATAAERVRAFAAALGESAVRLRLDFNESLDAAAFRRLCARLGPEVLQQVEYVEDPFPYAAADWQRARACCAVELAVDRAAGRATSGFGYAVLKPATDEVEALSRRLPDGVKMVFTSYMDHPLGQLYAAYEAAVARRKWGERVATCGLLTHELFEADAFVERLGRAGPVLVIPEGTGLGFDEMLESLPWKALS